MRQESPLPLRNKCRLLLVDSIPVAPGLRDYPQQQNRKELEKSRDRSIPR